MMTMREASKTAFETHDLNKLNWIVNTLRLKYGYSYDQIRPAVGRAVGREIKPCEWEDLMCELDMETSQG